MTMIHFFDSEPTLDTLQKLVGLFIEQARKEDKQ